MPKTRDAVDPVAAEKALKLNQVDRAKLELRLGSLGFNPGFPEGKLDKRARSRRANLISGLAMRLLSFRNALA